MPRGIGETATVHDCSDHVPSTCCRTVNLCWSDCVFEPLWPLPPPLEPRCAEPELLVVVVGVVPPTEDDGCVTVDPSSGAHAAADNVASVATANPIADRR